MSVLSKLKTSHSDHIVYTYSFCHVEVNNRAAFFDDQLID